MNKLYVATSGKELVSVGATPEILNDGIDKWQRAERRFGNGAPPVTITKQDYTVHPRWYDLAWFAVVRSKEDTR